VAQGRHAGRNRGRICIVCAFLSSCFALLCFAVTCLPSIQQSLCAFRYHGLMLGTLDELRQDVAHHHLLPAHDLDGLSTQNKPHQTRDNKMDTPTSSHCAALAHPNPFTVTLASIILIGVLVSYLPQHIKIIQLRTSAGLSPWWVLLGGLSSIAAIGNILTLPASRADVQCCSEISGGACAAALLGVAQIGLQWGCFMFMCVSL
jgi:hypothetical protein